jgi:uncharacterized protein (DUF1800 family)
MRRLLPLVAILLLVSATKVNTLTERQRAEHALNRLAFGPRPGEVDAVMQEGVDHWIARQLHPERIDDAAIDARLAGFATMRMANGEILRRYYAPVVEARKKAKGQADPQVIRREMMRELPPEARPQRVMEELQSQRIVRAAESERQLNEVLVDFWMNHFNVFAGKGIDRFLLTSYERDVIRPHILGRFDDLLLATAKAPAMLFYLDNARSNARKGLNENYARELMELHTLGVDGGYTQKDVTELARVLTGWTIDAPRQDGGSAEFRFRPFLHDRGSKLVLGQRIAAGGGIEEGERMIRFLAHQPATAHHIAMQLCQRLVADEPPPALVARVAKTFLDSGGDLRLTVKAVIDSPEFWEAGAAGTKVKSPFEYVISAIRAAGGRVENPLPVARTLQQIGEPLYGAQPPTGYSDASSAWINSGALMNRLNFALSLAANNVPGVVVHAADAEALGKRLGSPEFQRQ